MDNIRTIDEITKSMESHPLSYIIPLVLPLALDCEDYLGFCILSHWKCPTSDHPKANSIQRNEIIQILMLQGLSRQEAERIDRQSVEAYLDMKTISADVVSAHSVKQMEEIISDIDKLIRKPGDADPGSMRDLINRHSQLKKLYELLRSYIISRLTYYRQLLKKRVKEVTNAYSVHSTADTVDYTKVFIVHGHNGELKEAVARLIERQGIEAIILHEQVNLGNTIIEKFERNSNVGAAVCLFTADDFGRAKAETTDHKRARQNVVFEAGYFIGKLGRDHVVTIADAGVEIPSDMQGIVYTDSANWQFAVLKELKAIGYCIDYNKL